LRASLLALLLVPAAASMAGAAESGLPSCTALVPTLQRDPSSVRGGAALLGVGVIVDDVQPAQDTRMCTGVARYRDGSTHITYTAKWDDDKHTSFDVNAHETTETEATSRARSLRIRNHPRGRDGTFLLRVELPFCTDPEFTKLAEGELRYGISFRDVYYREPGYRIFAMDSNGYGSGILTNCIATVGDDNTKGVIFLGTDWAEAMTARKYEFYILSPGPDGFSLKNRLWEIGSE
jgi:hypothetical protein